MDEMFERAQVGGVVVGREKVWSLAYADDMVVLAKEEKELKSMIENMERYVRRKGLEVNVEKTKVMVFSKAGGRKKRYEWKWKGQELQQVNEFRYLGYLMNEGNNDNAHIKERVKKASKVMGIVWGIGERMFGHDVNRRLRMFDSLVKSVLMYGAEVWGWKEQKVIESMQERYLRWILGVDREVPGYIVREELKREKMRVNAAKRAVKFEDRMRVREDCKLLQECWKERKYKREKQEVREKFYERVGFSSVEIENEREKGRWWWKELEERDVDVDMQERREKIKGSKYNARYERLVKVEKGDYLKLEKSSERRMIARFRCGNEERENGYWRKDENRLCRLCKSDRETLEHLLKNCSELRESEWERELILEGGRMGIKWMKGVMMERAKIKE